MAVLGCVVRVKGMDISLPSPIPWTFTHTSALPVLSRTVYFTCSNPTTTSVNRNMSIDLHHGISEVRIYV